MKRFFSLLLLLRILFASAFIGIISILFFLEPIKQGMASLGRCFSSSFQENDQDHSIGRGLNSKGTESGIKMRWGIEHLSPPKNESVASDPSWESMLGPPNRDPSWESMLGPPNRGSALRPDLPDEEEVELDLR